MKIDEMGYVEDMRQRLGLDDENDTSKDAELEEMSALERVKLIAGWHLGDPNWISTFQDWCESQGLFISKFNPEKLEHLQNLVNQIQYTDKVTDKRYFELVGTIKETLK